MPTFYVVQFNISDGMAKHVSYIYIFFLGGGGGTFFQLLLGEDDNVNEMCSSIQKLRRGLGQETLNISRRAWRPSFFAYFTRRGAWPPWPPGCATGVEKYPNNNHLLACTHFSYRLDFQFVLTGVAVEGRATFTHKGTEQVITTTTVTAG